MVKAIEIWTMNICVIGIGAPEKNCALDLSAKIRRFGLPMPGAS
jgi:hypothetical protein